MSNEICCPKCGSTQLSANKKGFSGKNAALGMLLGGGILAGTIGSNKVIITCLSCGHKFKPGEGRKVINRQSVDVSESETNSEKSEKLKAFEEFHSNKGTNIQQEISQSGKIVAAIIIFILFVVILKMCSSTTTDDKSVNVENNTNAKHNKVQNDVRLADSTAAADLGIDEKLADSIAAVDSDIKNYYKIEKLDVNNTSQKNIFIYVKDVKIVELLNRILIRKYNPNKEYSMTIYYFTKKGISPTYLTKQFSDGITEEEKDNLFKFLYCNYTFNSSNNYESMNYPHR
jgi:hypothetical protein